MSKENQSEYKDNYKLNEEKTEIEPLTNQQNLEIEDILNKLYQVTKDSDPSLLENEM